MKLMVSSEWNENKEHIMISVMKVLKLQNLELSAYL